MLVKILIFLVSGGLLYKGTVENEIAWLPRAIVLIILCAIYYYKDDVNSFIGSPHNSNKSVETENCKPKSDPRCTNTFVNDSDDMKRFEAAVQHMRENAKNIHALINSRRVIGHELGLLDAVDNAHLTAEEKNILDQENTDRREYFTFLAKNSNPPHSYADIAQHFAKQWKEWPPQK